MFESLKLLAKGLARHFYCRHDGESTIAPHVMWCPHCGAIRHGQRTWELPHGVRGVGRSTGRSA